MTSFLLVYIKEELYKGNSFLFPKLRNISKKIKSKLNVVKTLHKV